MVGQVDKIGLRQYDTQGDAFGTFETMGGNTLEVHKNPDTEHKGEYKYTMLVRRETAGGEDLNVLMAEVRLASPEYFIKKFRGEY